jgi:hypothetical protein
MAREAQPATVCIEVPLKKDRELREEQRRAFLVKILYGLGGVLVLALLLFVGYKTLYPY